MVSAQYRSGDVFTQISDHSKPAALTASTHFLDRDTELWTMDTDTRHTQHMAEYEFAMLDTENMRSTPHTATGADIGPYRCENTVYWVLGFPNKKILKC